MTVTVFRESIEDSLDLTMTREIVENPTVEYDLLEDNVGYISISAFEEVTGDQFKTAADSLLGKGAKSLIIDLRNNGGGVVTASTDIADYLRKNTAYAEVLDTLTEDQIHRGNIEKVLVQSLYHDYTKIYRFCGQSQREFMKLIMKGYEIELINYCLRIVINHYKKPFDLNYKKCVF